MGIRNMAAQRRWFGVIAVVVAVIGAQSAGAATGARSVPPSGRPAPFVAPATSQTSTTTAIPVDGKAAGRVFDGVGAISGGGGNSRYLIDYPAMQRSAILDYLSKAHYG